MNDDTEMNYPLEDLVPDIDGNPPETPENGVGEQTSVEPADAVDTNEPGIDKAEEGKGDTPKKKAPAKKTSKRKTSAEKKESPSEDTLVLEGDPDLDELPDEYEEPTSAELAELLADKETLAALGVTDGGEMGYESEESEEDVQDDGDQVEDDPSSRDAEPESKNMQISTQKNTFGAPVPITTKEIGQYTIPSLQSREVVHLNRRAEAVTPQDQEDELWHEIRNAQITRRVLTGTLGGVERLENHSVIAIVFYKELRVIIPLSEMNLSISKTAVHRLSYDYYARAFRELNKMLGCAIDFIVKGADIQYRAIVGSRREAMMRKRYNYYMRRDDSGDYIIYVGRVLEARVTLVMDRAMRVEVFGVETRITSQFVSWEWIADLHERYSVGDQILVRLNKLERDEKIENLQIEVDIRSLTPNSVAVNLRRCKIQGKYAGIVTHVHRGVIFIRLNIGVNLIAHACYDTRKPGKNDVVSVVVTHIDFEKNTATGMVTRIIKQNI